MTYITPGALNAMAAKAVAAYNLSGESLNEVISGMAISEKLNSDQVKRLVETTNQLAYLSKLDGNDDRTFEFTVANYNDIMNSMVTQPNLEKSASAKVNPMDLVTSCFNSMEKVASEEKVATLEKLGKSERLAALKKVASHQRIRVNELESAEHDTLVKLAQHRAVICRDPEALEKMAKFDNQYEMTKLVFGHNKIATDVHKSWSPKDLEHIKACSDRLNLIKQAQEELTELRPKVEAAEEMLKEAFVSSIANAAKSAFGTLKSVGGALKKDGKKAFAVADAGLGASEINSNSKRKYNVWSSLRG